MRKGVECRKNIPQFQNRAVETDEILFVLFANDLLADGIFRQQFIDQIRIAANLLVVLRITVVIFVERFEQYDARRLLIPEQSDTLVRRSFEVAKTYDVAECLD